MTLHELLSEACADEGGRHSNGKYYTIVQVMLMNVIVRTANGEFASVLSVYPSDDEKTIYIDMEEA